MQIRVLKPRPLFVQTTIYWTTYPLLVHRDLKFENIMFENKRDDAQIKVIDFGLSKKFLDNQIGVMHGGAVGEYLLVWANVGVIPTQLDLEYLTTRRHTAMLQEHCIP